MTILVTGATGNVGGAVLHRLLELGLPARALVRHGSEERVDARADVATGDLSSVDDVAAAASGAEAAFLLCGYAGIDDGLPALREAGVRRVAVLSSSSAPSNDLTNAMTAYHVRTEQAVRESGLDWTFLRPHALMSNTYRWLPQLRGGDRVRLPFADVPISLIHPDDIADVAVRSLTDARHAGAAYLLSGPEALRPAEQVAVLAEATGRPLTFEAIPAEQARREMLEDTPEPYVDALFRFYDAGELDETTVRPSVREVTGRDPVPFRAWAHERRDEFR